MSVKNGRILPDHAALDIDPEASTTKAMSICSRQKPIRERARGRIVSVVLRKNDQIIDGMHPLRKSCAVDY
jgi:hypothetical protein